MPSRSDHLVAGDGLTRRAFLGTAVLPLVAAAACNRRPYDPRNFHTLDRSPVALLPAALRRRFLRR